ncbi:hypothetical protein HNR25_001871 [Streptomonospora salina]|uniref:Uncharacterized protein n=1 Tax=Streptomonospora salina TaxID=104205 RepID=A0A841ECD3_9ACTN|nr:hypothetical protein [Streptomonospora salina]
MGARYREGQVVTHWEMVDSELLPTWCSGCSEGVRRGVATNE